MSVFSRVLDVQNHYKLSQNKFEKAINVSNGYINTSKKNKVLSVSSAVLQKIVGSFEDIDPVWLLTGEGEMLKNNNKAIAIPTELPQGIPMLPFDAVGGFSAGDTEGVELDKIEERYHIPFLDKQGEVDFLVTIRGNSMYPKFADGSIAMCKIVKDKTKIEWGRSYILATRSYGVICKRVFKGEEGVSILCRSYDEKQYEDFDVEIDDVHDLAMIKGVVSIEYL